EFAPPMRPTRRLLDWRRFPRRVVECVVAVIGVGLHDSGPTGEMLLRVYASAIARIFEEGRRRLLAAKRPVVADIGPYPAGRGLAFGQNRRRGVIGMNALAPKDMSFQRGQDRIQRCDATADPIGQGRRVDLDPLAGVSGALAIERLMQQELRTHPRATALIGFVDR